MSKEKTGYPSIDKTHLEGTTYFQRNPIIPNISIYNLLSLLTMNIGNNTAIDSLNTKLTYKELKEKSVIISKSLKEFGVSSGDIITVSMDNYFQAIPIFLAANRIGAVVSFLNASLPIEELSKYLNEFESPIFFNYDKSDEYNSLLKRNSKVKQIVTLKKEDLNNKKFNETSNVTIGNSDFISYNDLELVSQYYKSPIKTLYGGNQESLVLFTSGSTGNPKSVLLTNKNVIAAEMYAKNTTPSDSIASPKVLICVPFSYPYGLVTSTLSTLFWGKEAILCPKLGKNNVGYYYQKNPGIIFGSPAFLDLTINNIPKKQDLSSVSHFLSGGDFLTEEHAKRGNDFFKEHGAIVEISNAYGNAETVSMGTTQMGIKIKPKTAGKFLYGVDTLILDPTTLKEKKYGEDGVLFVSGKHVFKEYYNNPTLTQEVKNNMNGKQYYNTGAMGSIDEEGYFTIVGREARFYINSALNKIYCDYVKKAICKLNGVEDCAVVKVPDDDLLYVNKAYIVMKPGFEIAENSKNELIQALHNPIISSDDEVLQLKDYEIPTYIEFVTELPRHKDSDKVDYSLLEELAKSELDKNPIKTLKR